VLSVFRRVPRPVRWTALVVVVLLAGALGGLWYVAGNRPSYAGMTLRLATGNTDGVYYPLGQGLQSVWDGRLGVNTTVLTSNGSVENVRLLESGQADMAISAADAADTGYASFPGLRALGRLYDDYVQVVVRADEPTITKFADLRGHTVSMGAPGSGVALIAGRLMAAAGLRTGDVTNIPLGLAGEIDALEKRRIDAFVWSGGLPTPGMSAPATEGKIRVLDLSDLVGPIQAAYPNLYAPGLIPDSVYGATGAPPTTLVVPDLLLATDRLSDDLAQALIGALFDGQAQLIQASQTARSIDVQKAIYTAPIPLHDGAINYYRSAKA
jgi:hypothetical protein